MLKEEKAKVILQVVEDSKGEIYTNADTSISKLYSIVINLLGMLEESTKMPYNQILKDLEDTSNKDK